jgi:hypothetical protein
MSCDVLRARRHGLLDRILRTAASALGAAFSACVIAARVQVCGVLVSVQCPCAWPRVTLLSVFYLYTSVLGQWRMVIDKDTYGANIYMMKSAILLSKCIEKHAY